MPNLSIILWLIEIPSVRKVDISLLAYHAFQLLQNTVSYDPWSLMTR